MSKLEDMPEMPQPPEMPLDFKVSCEIALTPDQKRIVKQETGRDMEELILADESGMYTERMTKTSPDDYTVKAIRQARMLNDYDEAYRKYLEDLAEWEENLNKPDEIDEMLEQASVAMEQEAERLKLFYMKENEACQNARQIAKIALGKKSNPTG